MSAFNEANELASQLVWGRRYCGDEPCEKLDELVFVQSGERRVVPAPRDSSHEAWAGTAVLIESLPREGWVPQVPGKRFDVSEEE
jgi:hypothetical protein